MSTKNVQQKERHVQNVKSLSILQECASQISKREKCKFKGTRVVTTNCNVGSVGTTHAMSKSEWHADVR